MNRQQIAFAINLLHLDFDMAQNAEAVVELLDDMHRGNNDSISYNWYSFVLKVTYFENIRI